jgi:hypothetical protein
VLHAVPGGETTSPPADFHPLLRRRRLGPRRRADALPARAVFDRFGLPVSLWTCIAGGVVASFVEPDAIDVMDTVDAGCDERTPR